MEELIKKTAEDLRQLHVDLKGIKGFAGAKAVAPRIIAKVNELKRLKGMSGAEAKEMAIGLVVELVPLPGWMPKFVAKWALGWIIEGAYQAYKKASA